MSEILFYYIFGGVVFYICLWVWKEVQNLFAERKFDKWVARASIAFPLWPIFLLIIILFFIFKKIKGLLKLSEF
jgi:hypothetical protein